jgi:hypothetical protein
MAPLQKRALYSLLTGFVMAGALTVLFIVKGAAAFDEDEGFRFIVYALWIGVPVVYLILINLTLRKPTQIDERDRQIIERAPKTQLLAIFLTLAAWLIVLTEVHRDSGQIPVIYLTLIFISLLIVSTLAQSLGILIGYWKSR